MASAHKRKFLFHITRGRAGKLSRRPVAKVEAERLRAAGERIDERESERWYVRYRDAGGAWRDERSTARTKTEALRLAGDLERKAERQRHGLEPLPGDPGMSLAELCRWWLKEKCPPASVSREESRLRNQLLSHPIAALPLSRVTAVRFEERLREMELAGGHGPPVLRALDDEGRPRRHAADPPAAPAVPRPRHRRLRLRVHVPALGREGAHDGHQHGAAHAGDLHPRRPARGLRPPLPPLQAEGHAASRAPPGRQGAALP